VHDKYTSHPRFLRVSARGFINPGHCEFVPARSVLLELRRYGFNAAGKVVEMKSFEAFATVQPQGDVRVSSVPFAPGTEVEITISLKRKSTEDFAAAWNRVCRDLRRLPQVQSITDEQIQQEINDHRAHR
jgi:hypothetical protein